MASPLREARGASVSEDDFVFVQQPHEEPSSLANFMKATAGAVASKANIFEDLRQCGSLFTTGLVELNHNKALFNELGASSKDLEAQFLILKGELVNFIKHCPDITEMVDRQLAELFAMVRSNHIDQATKTLGRILDATEKQHLNIETLLTAFGPVREGFADIINSAWKRASSVPQHSNSSASSCGAVATVLGILATGTLLAIGTSVPLLGYIAMYGASQTVVKGAGTTIAVRLDRDHAKLGTAFEDFAKLAEKTRVLFEVLAISVAGLKDCLEQCQSSTAAVQDMVLPPTEETLAYLKNTIKTAARTWQRFFTAAEDVATQLMSLNLTPGANPADQDAFEALIKNVIARFRLAAAKHAASFTASGTFFGDDDSPRPTTDSPAAPAAVRRSDGVHASLSASSSGSTSASSIEGLTLYSRTSSSDSVMSDGPVGGRP